jgi:glycosyltransferase involved in cell wall biosynthesis
MSYVINQILPSLVQGDAVVNVGFYIKQILLSQGHICNLYFQNVEQGLTLSKELEVQNLLNEPTDILIYHLCTYAPICDNVFLSSSGKKVIIYHNITPSHFLAPYDLGLSKIINEASQGVKNFKSVDLAIADSDFNAMELKELGFTNVYTVPLFFEEHQCIPDAEILDGYKDGWINFLFVGRLAPNKCQEDVIKAFAYYCNYINRQSRLILVGSTMFSSYTNFLKQVAELEGVQQHVIFTEKVPFSQLKAYYQVAHIFMCMSEHEGFCVPLLEAMQHDIPIIAYASSAVPETLGEAGILVNQKDIPVIAELAHLLVNNQSLRSKVIQSQRSRLENFKPEVFAENFMSVLSKVF